MNPTVPAGTASGRRRPSRNSSGDAITTTNRVATRPPESGMCGCPTPLVRDPETGEWLHLATGSRCPNRLDGAR
jgi:hypothetical protein